MSVSPKASTTITSSAGLASTFLSRLTVNVSSSSSVSSSFRAPAKGPAFSRSTPVPSEGSSSARTGFGGTEPSGPQPKLKSSSLISASLKRFVTEKGPNPTLRNALSAAVSAPSMSNRQRGP